MIEHEVHLSGTVDRIVIDPAGARMDKGYVIFLVAFWLVWTPASLFVLSLALETGDAFLWIWTLFSALGVLGVPYVLLQRRGREIVEVTDSEVRVHAEGGLFADRWRATKNQVERLGLERFGPRGDEETVYSLNLVKRGSFLRRRRLLAATLHPDEKRRAYVELAAALRRRGYAAEIVDTYSVAMAARRA